MGEAIVRRHWPTVFAPAFTVSVYKYPCGSMGVCVYVCVRVRVCVCVCVLCEHLPALSVCVCVCMCDSMVLCGGRDSVVWWWTRRGVVWWLRQRNVAVETDTLHPAVPLPLLPIWGRVLLYIAWAGSVVLEVGAGLYFS
jgi:hypothetical protein